MNEMDYVTCNESARSYRLLNSVSGSNPVSIHGTKQEADNCSSVRKIFVRRKSFFMLISCTVCLRYVAKADIERSDQEEKKIPFFRTFVK